MSIQPQVALHLLDPEGAVTVAKGARKRIDTWLKRSWRGKPPVLHVYVNPKGQLLVTELMNEVRRTRSALLGKLTWRPARRQLAARGVLLGNLWDELVEAFALVGLSAVYVQERK